MSMHRPSALRWRQLRVILAVALAYVLVAQGSLYAWAMPQNGSADFLAHGIICSSGTPDDPDPALTSSQSQDHKSGCCDSGCLSAAGELPAPPVVAQRIDYPATGECIARSFSDSPEPNSSLGRIHGTPRAPRPPPRF